MSRKRCERNDRRSVSSKKATARSRKERLVALARLLGKQAAVEAMRCSDRDIDTAQSPDDDRRDRRGPP